MFLLNGEALNITEDFMSNGIEPSYQRLPEDSRFYCTGKPCKNGHYSKRYVCNNECVQCRLEKNASLKEQQKKWADENKDRTSILNKKRYYRNLEKERARSRKKYADNPQRVNETNKKWISKNPKLRTFYAAKSRAELRKRIPAWADMNAIREFYKNCPDGYHVDHIIPLRGKTVCGLHVLNNLQYLPASENQRKFNKLEAQYVYA
jgi:hypothetical protein